MRVRANLTGKELRSVLAFLQATNTDPRERAPLSEHESTQGAPPTEPELETGPASTDPQMITEGKTLTNERACLGCHVIGGIGGQVGPALDGVIGRRGPQFVRQKLADPTFDNASSMMPNFGLSAQEIEAIVAYLNSLNGG
jgi:mono/diheme cytochrome c family protein